MEARFEQSNVLNEPRVLASVKRISWAAVFAGVLIAVVIQITLSLLGIGIGLSTVDPKTEENPVQGLGIGTAIWYVVSSLIALFTGGWVAGRLSRTNQEFDGAIHGLLTWSIVSLLTLYFVTTAIGGILGGVGRLVGNTLGVVGNVAQRGVEAAGPEIRQQLQNVDMNKLKSEATLLLRQTGKAELQPGALEERAKQSADNAGNTAGNIGAAPQYTDAQVEGLLGQLFAEGKDVAQEVDRTAVVNVIVARTGKSRAEAEQIADNWITASKQASAKVQQMKQQAEAKARQVADDAADAASTAAILAFVSLLLGAGVAYFGAKKGTESKDDVVVERPAVT
ncbi:hypothetical protein [Longitalea arenae]|uniref:hypothetical protein n=1 Tax=Longitalea arenae TaxID=2812558 RepID=UPI001967B65C|nr:hypothetical protein [Longitalea arenae]